MRRPLLALAVFGLVVLSCTASEGLVRRHDVTDDTLIRFAEPFDAVGKVGGVGDGTLIAPHWVLTAGHVARGAAQHARNFVEFRGARYGFDAVYVHPEFGTPPAFDLALVHLTQPVAEVEPLGMLSPDEFFMSVEPGTELVLVGHGAQGIGNASERAEDGRRRAGTNRVWELRDQSVVFFFERPGEPQVTELEVIPGPGDSGGPALLRSADGSYRVVAVSSSGAPGSEGPGSYGARDFFARIDTVASWLEEVLEGRVAPTPIETGVHQDRNAAIRPAVAHLCLDSHMPHAAY